MIFGGSAAMGSVRRKVEKVATTNLAVLLCGESGTGKEVVAKCIHLLSPWRKGQFVKVSCPAIPAALVESELFGYERGSFTGARTSKPGRVESAHRGTLFLDEIAELDPSLQAKLLTLLQDGQFCRIGATEDMRVEARVICATNRDLKQVTEAGHFRSDLFYRINTVSLHLPPLRERPDDIPALAEYFVRVYSERFDCKGSTLSSRTISRMQAYHWPGNIRQLENTVKRFVLLKSEETITSEITGEEDVHNAGAEAGAPDSIPLKKITRNAVKELKRKIILNALKAHRWNRKLAAQRLQVSYRGLLYMMREVGLPKRRGAALSEPLPDAQEAGEGASDWQDPTI